MHIRVVYPRNGGWVGGRGGGNNISRWDESPTSLPKKWDKHPHHTDNFEVSLIPLTTVNEVSQ